MLFLNDNIIERETLAILRQLMGIAELQDFFLVGGTALALQIGHRLSIDLDFFSSHPIHTQTLTESIQKKFRFEITNVANNTLLGFIEDVKVDFITHAYPLVNQIKIVDDIRLASLEDIAAMKLNAVAHSGQRLKDFWDIYFLLEIMPFAKMLDAYKIKYPGSNPVIALKAITYFEDIDFALDKPILIKNISFNSLKKRLLAAVENVEKVF